MYTPFITGNHHRHVLLLLCYQKSRDAALRRVQGPRPLLQPLRSSSSSNGREALKWAATSGEESRRRSGKTRSSSSRSITGRPRSSCFSSAIAAHQQNSSLSLLFPAAASAPPQQPQQQQRSRRRRKAVSLSELRAAKGGRLYGKGRGGALSPGEDEEDDVGEDVENEEEEDEDDEEEEDEEDGDEEDEEGGEYDPMTPKGPLDNNNYGEVWLPIQARPRRNRKSYAVRQLLKETVVKPSSLIYPLFVHDKEESVPIASMPGQRRLSIADLVKEVAEAMSYGIHAFMLFPSVDASLKTNMGEESYNVEGLIPRALAAVKEKHPHALLLADVALDPYSCYGQDGVVDEQTGEVLNDISVHQACKQAVTLARAGADMVCPSEMMDGRIAAIRESLDMEGFTSVSILAYSCKYASSLYSPFRDALDSHPRPLKNSSSADGNTSSTDGSTDSSKSSSKGACDKNTYQMDFSNAREAEREAELGNTPEE